MSVLSHSQLRRLCGNLLTLSLETPCDGQGAAAPAAATGPHSASEASGALPATADAPRRLSSRVPLFERRVNRILNKATPQAAGRAADEAFWLLTRGARPSPAGADDAAGAAPACGRWSDASDTAGAAAAAAAGTSAEQWPEQAQKDAAATFVRSLVSRAEAEAAPYGDLYADVFSRILDRLQLPPPPPAATAETPVAAAAAAAAATPSAAGASPRSTPLKRTLHNALVDRLVSRGGTPSFQTLGAAAFCAGLFTRGALPQQILHVTVRKVLRMRDGEVAVAAESPPVSPDRSGGGGGGGGGGPSATIPPTDREVMFVMHLLSHCGQGLEVPSAKPFLDAYYQRLGAIAACATTHSLLRHRLHMLLERRQHGTAPPRAASQLTGATAAQQQQQVRFLVKRACARGVLEGEELDAAVLQPLLRKCGGGAVTQVRRYPYHAVVSVTAPMQPSFRDLKALNELVRSGGFEVVAA